MLLEMIQVVVLSNPLERLDRFPYEVMELKSQPRWVTQLERKGEISMLNVEVGLNSSSLRINRHGKVSSYEIQSKAKLQNMLRSLENSLGVRNGMFDDMGRFETAIYPAPYGTVTRMPYRHGGYVLNIAFKRSKSKIKMESKQG